VSAINFGLVAATGAAVAGGAFIYHGVYNIAADDSRVNALRVVVGFDSPCAHLKSGWNA
jgi:uncharacterized protein (UPF0264 family)